MRNDQIATPEGRGAVGEPIIGGLPAGYIYGVTRYADVILQEALADRLANLFAALAGFGPTLDELRAGGGGRTVFVRRFDESLAALTENNTHVWGKRNITISKLIDGAQVYNVRGHEIDMFGAMSETSPFPGVAVEMEWNNKDPFFDRDLVNFQALHREGVIAAGVIVTRGPRLQRLISGAIRSKDGGFKYGPSSTHWEKLLPRVNLGGGGECPLLLIGIQPERIIDREPLERARQFLDQAAALQEHWRAAFTRYRDAQPEIRRLREAAYALLPPVGEPDEATEEP